MRLTRRSLGALAAALFGATFAAGCVVEDDGHIQVRWDFIDTKTPVGTAGYKCSEVGVTQVGVTLFSHVDNVDLAEVRVACLEDVAGGQVLDIGGLATGGYNITTKFYDMNGKAVAEDVDTFNPSDPNAPIVKCEGTDPSCVLSTVLSVNATGDFNFAVDYGTAGGRNCQSGMNGDSGVGQQALLVNNSKAQSIPLRLVIPGITPAAPGKTYALGEVEICVENTVTQTMFNHFIGFYTMAIKGLKVTTVPALTCYQGAPVEFRITSIPAAQPTTFVIPFAPAAGAETGCNAT